MVWRLIRSFFVLTRMAKPLVDAIVALPTDDAALSLAAAAVLYFLASDVSVWSGPPFFSNVQHRVKDYDMIAISYVESNCSI